MPLFKLATQALHKDTDTRQHLNVTEHDEAIAAVVDRIIKRYCGG